MDISYSVRKKVFEAIENAVKNNIQYNGYFIIVHFEDFCYVIEKDVTTLRLILGLNEGKDIFAFPISKLDEILPKLVRNGFRVAIIRID